MIYVCPVKGCGKTFEMGSDHQREPCAACYRLGWRCDAVGNIWLKAPTAARHFSEERPA